MTHHSLCRIFNRDYTVVTFPGFHLCKDSVDGSLGDTDGGMAEMFDRSCLGESTLRAEERRMQGLFEGQAGGHNLAKDVSHTGAIQWPGIAADDIREDLSFPLWPVEYGRCRLAPGGQRSRTAREVMDRTPKRLVEHAVRGMLPKNSLGRAIYRNLHVNIGPDHDHAAQKPKVHNVTL